MRGIQFEFALKGLFLGLLFYTAMQVQIRSVEDPPVAAWELTGKVGLYLVAGLGAAIVLGLIRQIADLARILRKPHAFLLFLLLENPLLIYLGLIGGLAFGAFQLFEPGDNKPNLVFLSIIGAILGYCFGWIRGVPDFRRRATVSLVLGAGVVYLVIWYLQGFREGMFMSDPEARQNLGLLILLGLPFYYLLCFVGVAEESEAEIAGLCTMLGLAIHLLQFPKNMPAAGLLVPVAFYVTYSLYVLPYLRVFKHTLRGFIYMEVGKMRRALQSFRRALQLDPTNALAQQGMDWLHANIEIDKVDAATLGLLDPARCLKRVKLHLAQTPTQEQLNRAQHLLNLVEKLWPKLTSHVIYYRAVAAAHQKDLDKASELLNDLLSPEGWFPDDEARKAILFDAWQLVLLVHPGLKQHVGDPQLALPGRRIEAIGAVERQIFAQPTEPSLAEFRKTLYEDLSEAEYFDAAKERVPADFSHAYVEELGQSLIGNPDHWHRGAQFLRMAANGLPLRRPSIFARLAEAYAKAGETLQATKYLQYVRDCGLEVGLANLPASEKAVYFATVKRLADEAAAREDADEAIFNYSLATHAPDSGVATLRLLAEQYEKKKDVMNALRITEKALCYDGRDPDLLAKKDRYYYSLETNALSDAAKTDDNVRKFFDVPYCAKKAKSILDSKTDDLDNLDWAKHLLSLAVVMQPQNMTALVQKARIHLRLGERDEGLKILEDVREMKPGTSEESDAWYFVQKQLGVIYLDEINRADLAIPVLLEYLNHVGSGAQTHFDLGRAYEAVGDKTNALKHYNTVLAYENHPLRWDAEAAIRRLKGQ